MVWIFLIVFVFLLFRVGVLLFEFFKLEIPAKHKLLCAILLILPIFLIFFPFLFLLVFLLWFPVGVIGVILLYLIGIFSLTKLVPNHFVRRHRGDFVIYLLLVLISLLFSMPFQENRSRNKVLTPKEVYCHFLKCPIPKDVVLIEGEFKTMGLGYSASLVFKANNATVQTILKDFNETHCTGNEAAQNLNDIKCYKKIIQIPDESYGIEYSKKENKIIFSANAD